MNPDEIELIIRANVDKTVSVVYAHGTAQLFVHTVDDEGFVSDLVRETRNPPPKEQSQRGNSTGEPENFELPKAQTH